MTAAINWNRFKRHLRPEEVESRSQDGYKREGEVQVTTHSALSSRESSKFSFELQELVSEILSNFSGNFSYISWKLSAISSRFGNFSFKVSKMASATYTGQKKKQKKNAFFMFMEEKRIEASGQKLTRGFAELAELLSDSWKALSKEERAVYEERARKYKETTTRVVGGVQRPSYTPGDDPNAHYLRAEKEKWRQQFETKRQENRAHVWNMFETDDWMSKSIVVCSFSTFFSPDPLSLMEEFVPAEVGLTAFSLNDGVIDSFARMIDPNDDIPKDRSLEVSQRVEQLGLPEIGSCEELKDYKNLLGTIECFFAKYGGKCSGEYLLYALNSDLEMVTKCIEWICENAGRSIPFKVLSLSRWAHLASTSAELNRQLRRPKYDDPADTSTPRLTDSQLHKELQIAAMKLQHSPNRVVGKSLTPVFFYPHQYVYPLAEYGIFLTEESVDDIIRFNNNYTCYEEMSCLYHMKRGDGVPYCALCISNRYAFYLLEFLTMSNTVQNIWRGRHFPAIVGPQETTEQRRERRLYGLRRWGLTELELNQKDVTLELQAKEKENRKTVQRRGNRMEGQQHSTTEQGRIWGQQRLSAEPDDTQLGPILRDEGGVPHSFTGDLPPVFRGIWKK